MDNIELGKRLQEARKAKGLKQEDVANFLHLTYKDISAMEHGRINISIDHIHRLCQILEISELELLADKCNMDSTFNKAVNDDINRMILGCEDGDMAMDIMLKALLSKGEIALFQEVLKFKGIEKEMAFQYLLPYLVFIETVNSIKNDTDMVNASALAFMRDFSKFKEDRLNKKFCKRRE